ncbi:MAG: hypothetical protein KDK72_05835 [Chlamydiia bacterium]|nr:hypothetical protein [Chlamydiia bacterium]
MQVTRTFPIKDHSQALTYAKISNPNTISELYQHCIEQQKTISDQGNTISLLKRENDTKARRIDAMEHLIERHLHAILESIGKRLHQEYPNLIANMTKLLSSCTTTNKTIDQKMFLARLKNLLEKQQIEDSWVLLKDDAENIELKSFHEDASKLENDSDIVKDLQTLHDYFSGLSGYEEVKAEHFLTGPQQRPRSDVGRLKQLCELVPVIFGAVNTTGHSIHWIYRESATLVTLLTIGVALYMLPSPLTYLKMLYRILRFSSRVIPRVI